ncbi:ATP-binding protein [Natronohydrobacter thiooxidans]|uniref:ATP-binding protein n=1 Tax=Natronohydrobacter thiooxidans TaxID=87172 RepID=UPI0008FF77EB|nr:ATP-binding protein [Natronohydrobacter thiooxidans]
MTGQSELQSEFHLACKGELWAIRNALDDVERFLLEHGVTRCRIADLSLILAEAMTNIVRHGYRDSAGEIVLSLRLEGRRLRCELTDRGQPFDPSALGRSAPEPAQFNEGGYGWFIIRHLSDGVSYSRRDGHNLLRFSVPFDPVN